MKKTIHIDGHIEIDAEMNFKDGPVYINSIRINGIAVRKDPFGPWYMHLRKRAEEYMYKQFTGKGGRKKEQDNE